MCSFVKLDRNHWSVRVPPNILYPYGIEHEVTEVRCWDTLIPNSEKKRFDVEVLTRLEGSKWNPLEIYLDYIGFSKKIRAALKKNNRHKEILIVENEWLGPVELAFIARQLSNIDKEPYTIVELWRENLEIIFQQLSDEWWNEYGKVLEFSDEGYAHSRTLITIKDPKYDLYKNDESVEIALWQRCRILLFTLKVGERAKIPVENIEYKSMIIIHNVNKRLAEIESSIIMVKRKLYVTYK